MHIHDPHRLALLIVRRHHEERLPQADSDQDRGRAAITGIAQAESAM